MRNEIVYMRWGVVPVMRNIRKPIIDFNSVTCSFGCSVVHFVSVIPFGQGMDTVFEFSIPN